MLHELLQTEVGVTSLIALSATIGVFIVVTYLFWNKILYSKDGE